MTDHPSPEQIAAYRGRSLAPGDLVAVDFHLAICENCRKSVAGPEPNATLLRGVGGAKQNHLSYEEMEGYAEGTLEPTLREFVLSHVALCGRCAKELGDFAEFVPVMDAPVDRSGAKTKQVRGVSSGFWRKISAGLTLTQWSVAAAAAAAAVVLAIVIPSNLRKDRPADQTAVQQFGPSRTDALAEAQLATLPPDVRIDVSQIVESKQGVRPASLSRLSAPAVSKLLGPVGVVVLDLRPTMRWSPVAGTKAVTVFTQAGSRIAESGALTGSEWQLPISLARGESYRWTLEANGAVIGQGAFAVLAEKDAQEWTGAASRYTGSHLLLGAMAQHMGMLDEARREYDALQLEKPQSETAARLLRNLEAIRDRR